MGGLRKFPQFPPLVLPHVITVLKGVTPMSLRWIWVAVAVVFMLPITACAKDAATAPISDYGIFGFAYGHVFKGEPTLTVVNDTLYVDGSSGGSRQPYYPRRSASTDTVVPCNDNPEFDAVLDEAHAAARVASMSEGWSDGFIRVLNAHLGNEVMSFEPRVDAIKVQFADGNVIMVNVPCGAPETPRLFNLQNEIERQRAQFNDYVNRKVWVVWGSGYTILVPPPRHNEMLVAMEKIASGLTITDVERQNTPFIDSAFEADFRLHMGEVR